MSTPPTPGSQRLLSSGDALLAPATDLLEALRQIAAATLADDQVATRAEIDRFLRAHRDAALRSCVQAHLTGSALVANATAQRTLLMLHRKLGRWFQPGGHADGNTNLAAVALQEATEETGIIGLRILVPAIDVDIHRVALPNEAPHLHLDVRHVVIAPAGAREVANRESLALRWVDATGLDDLDPPIDPSTRRLVARGLEHARHVLAEQTPRSQPR
ncbi:MAG: NUDIX hydrolase [Acidimicrobiales bacterium]